MGRVSPRHVIELILLGSDGSHKASRLDLETVRSSHLKSTPLSNDLCKKNCQKDDATVAVGRTDIVPLVHRRTLVLEMTLVRPPPRCRFSDSSVDGTFRRLCRRAIRVYVLSLRLSCSRGRRHYTIQICRRQSPKCDRALTELRSAPVSVFFLEGKDVAEEESGLAEMCHRKWQRHPTTEGSAFRSESDNLCVLESL